jgi:hypothetical protein
MAKQVKQLVQLKDKRGEGVGATVVVYHGGTGKKLGALMYTLHQKWEFWDRKSSLTPALEDDALLEAEALYFRGMGSDIT